MNYYTSVPQRAGLILNLDKAISCLIPHSSVIAYLLRHRCRHKTAVLVPEVLKL